MTDSIKQSSPEDALKEKEYKGKPVIDILWLVIIIGILVLVLVLPLKKNNNKSCFNVSTDDPYSRDDNSLYLYDDGLCEGNYFDCDDFCTQQDAQRVFDNCYDNYRYDNDIHNLDGNGDGVACESL